MKQRYFIGNLKMNLSSPKEAEQYLAVFSRESRGKEWKRTTLVLAPPYVHLARFAKGIRENVCLGAQDVFYEKEGSFTGEVSAPMLSGEGVTYVIVGHSERRIYAGETDEMVARKMRAALKYGLIPILCVGETEEERKRGETVSVINRQVRIAFRDIVPLDAEKVVIAYEPRWAIGTDRIPTSEEILAVRVLLSRTITEFYGTTVAERVAILYGGSVKASLLDEVCFRSQMNGVLVGRESLSPYEVVKMTDMIDRYEPPVHNKTAKH